MSALPVPSRLAECEDVIERGLTTFVQVGEALLEIRDSRLYRETHGTFEDYCRERWGWTRQQANRTIAAAETTAVLEPIGSTPSSESVARELAPLRSEPEVLRGAWTSVVERHGPSPTAAQVQEVVTELREQRNPPPVEVFDRDPSSAPAPADRMAVHYSSATDEWATPQDFFDLVNREFHFTTDVCALPGSAKCDHYFTPETDGLAQTWTGTCWMNPPYGDEIRQWVAKAHEAAALHGATVVCLVPARVDTGWWWDHCRHGEIRFLRGRLKFGTVGTAAPFPSALVVFSPTVAPDVVWWERP